MICILMEDPTINKIEVKYYIRLWKAFRGESKAGKEASKWVWGMGEV